MTKIAAIIREPCDAGQAPVTRLIDEHGRCVMRIVTRLIDEHGRCVMRIDELESACRTALDVYARVSRVGLPGDVAGDLVHAREALRRALHEI